jgi:hypothetical protein
LEPLHLARQRWRNPTRREPDAAVPAPPAA